MYAHSPPRCLSCLKMQAITVCTIPRMDIKWEPCLPALVGGHEKSHIVLHEESASYCRHPEQIQNPCSHLQGALHKRNCISGTAVLPVMVQRAATGYV